MKLTTKDYFAIAGILLLFAVGFFAGYKVYPTMHKCPQMTQDTLYVYDTTTYVIPDTIPYYIIKYDSIIYRDTVFKDVDTAAILKDYYAEHYYTRYWSDTLLLVTQHDVLSQNKFLESEFTYKLLKPRQIIFNTNYVTIYSRYLYFDIELPFKDFKYSTTGMTYAFPTGQAGVGYNWGLKSLTVKGGIKIKKWD